MLIRVCGKLKIVYSKQADRAFGSFTDRVSVGTILFVFGVLARPNIILVCTVKYVRYVGVRK